MSYLSSNRKERFPIEKSGNGSVRRLRSRLVVSADNRRATAAQRAADTAPSRRTLLTRGKRQRTANDTTAEPTTPNKAATTRSRWCRRGTSGGKKNPPICPRRQPPALDKRPTRSPPNVSDPNRQTANHRRSFLWRRRGATVAPPKSRQRVAPQNALRP